MKTIAQQFASDLHGRQYGNEITSFDEQIAKQNNLLVIFGYSDDTIELRGAKTDEIGSWNGLTTRIDMTGNILRTFDVIEMDSHLNNLSREELGVMKSLYNDYITEETHILWVRYSVDGYTWVIDVLSNQDISLDIGYFDIMEDEQKFCRGVVLQLKK